LNGAGLSGAVTRFRNNRILARTHLITGEGKENGLRPDEGPNNDKQLFELWIRSHGYVRYSALSRRCAATVSFRL
jgi:hypothetical protein